MRYYTLLTGTFLYDIYCTGNFYIKDTNFELREGDIVGLHHTMIIRSTNYTGFPLQVVSTDTGGKYQCEYIPTIIPSAMKKTVYGYTSLVNVLDFQLPISPQYILIRAKKRSTLGICVDYSKYHICTWKIPCKKCPIRLKCNSQERRLW